MLNDKMIRLIERAKNINLQEPLDPNDIHNVENKLQVNFSDEFKVLNQQISYEFLGAIDFYNFGSEDVSSVIYETIELRKNVNLPSNVIIIAQEASSLIFLILENNIERTIICSLEDGYNLCNGKPFEYNPTIFPTFADFFEYLLDQEEELRGGRRIITPVNMDFNL